MADVNQKVLALVRPEIEKDPHVPNDVLARKAAAIDRSVRKLSKLQFHGTYRLTAARQLAADGRGPAGQKRATKLARGSATAATRGTAPARRIASSSANADAARAAVRVALLEFAGEVAQAENTSDVVGVLSTIDRYVDRVVSALARS